MTRDLHATNWQFSFDSIRGQRLFHQILFFYLGTFVLEGPLRYLLSSLGLGPMLYVRDFLLLQAVVLAIVSTRQDIKRNYAFVTLVWIIAAHSLWAFYLQGGALQLMFGLKVFLPVLFGAIVYPFVRLQSSACLRIFSILFMASVIGVICNVWIKYPWEGMSYDVGGIVNVYTTRDWSAMGIERLEGFSRSSFDAAIQIFLFAILIVSSHVRVIIKVLTWTLAGVAIILTTTKGVLLAFVAVTIVLLVNILIPWKRQVRVALLVIGAIFSVSLPLFLPWILNQGTITLDGQNQVFVFSSFLSRVFDTWPNAFSLVQDHGSMVLGRGIGGIGFPQLLTEPELYNPADSLFVYLYATFGVFAFFYVALVVFKAIRLGEWFEAESSFYYCVLMGLLVYGFTTNVVESAVFAVFIGFLLGHIFGHHEKLEVARYGVSEHTFTGYQPHLPDPKVSHVTLPRSSS